MRELCRTKARNASLPRISNWSSSESVFRPDRGDDEDEDEDEEEEEEGAEGSGAGAGDDDIDDAPPGSSCICTAPRFSGVCSGIRDPSSSLPGSGSIAECSGSVWHSLSYVTAAAGRMFTMVPEHLDNTSVFAFSRAACLLSEGGAGAAAVENTPLLPLVLLLGADGGTAAGGASARAGASSSELTKSSTCARPPSSANGAAEAVEAVVVSVLPSAASARSLRSFRISSSRRRFSSRSCMRFLRCASKSMALAQKTNEYTIRETASCL